MVVVAVLFLVIFGPSKMPQMARDIGKFVSQARGAIDEFKDELTSEGADDDKSRPARSREEGSRGRKDGQSKANGSSREDNEGEGQNGQEEGAGLEEGSPDSAKRERAEYDL